MSHFWVSLVGFSLQNETLILDDLFYLYNVNAAQLSYSYESSVGATEALKKTEKDMNRKQANCYHSHTDKTQAPCIIL